MTTQRTVIMIMALALLFTGGQALAGKVQDEPGYVDLEWIEIPDSANEVQDIDLGSILKSVAKDARESGEDELAQALAMVHSLRVKGYSVDKENGAEARRAVEKIMAQLKKDGWNRLIYIKDDEETVSVSTMYKGDDLVGLMVVSFEPNDSVLFANVMGDLNLGTLMKLAANMDSGDLEDLLGNLDGTGNLEIEMDED